MPGPDPGRHCDIPARVLLLRHRAQHRRPHLVVRQRGGRRLWVLDVAVVPDPDPGTVSCLDGRSEAVFDLILIMIL